jgi:hypothetical protein
VDRYCVFCHKPIAPDAPTEHVIPKWVGNAYPDAMFTTKGPNGRKITAKVIEITVDTVCRACNHGWMSDLEASCAPMLKPMLKGQTQGLSLAKQTLLAQWATKTAMTLDQTVPTDMRVFSPDECKQLMDRQLPPPGTGVQLARYAGSGVFLTFGHNDLYRAAILDPVNPGPPDGHRTAIRIDQLILEVNVTSDANLDLRSVATDGQPVTDILQPIWPASAPVAWPARIAMGDATWASFVEPDTPDAAKWQGPGHVGAVPHPAQQPSPDATKKPRP